MNHGFFQNDTGIIDYVSGTEIICSINNNIPIFLKILKRIWSVTSEIKYFLTLHLSLNIPDGFLLLLIWVFLHLLIRIILVSEDWFHQPYQILLFLFSPLQLPSDIEETGHPNPPAPITRTLAFFKFFPDRAARFQGAWSVCCIFLFPWQIIYHHPSLKYLNITNIHQMSATNNIKLVETFQIGRLYTKNTLKFIII